MSCPEFESNRIEWELKASLKLLNCQLVNVNSILRWLSWHLEIFHWQILAYHHPTITTISITKLRLGFNITLEIGNLPWQLVSMNRENFHVSTWPYFWWKFLQIILVNIESVESSEPAWKIGNQELMQETEAEAHLCWVAGMSRNSLQHRAPPGQSSGPDYPAIFLSDCHLTWG